MPQKTTKKPMDKKKGENNVKTHKIQYKGSTYPLPIWIRSANNAEAGRGAMGVRRGRLRRAATTIVAAAEMWGTRGD